MEDKNHPTLHWPILLPGLRYVPRDDLDLLQHRVIRHLNQQIFLRLFLIFFPAHLGDDLPLLRAGAEHEAAVVADAALVEPLAGLQLRGPRTKSRLDPRHVQTAPAEELSRTFDNTNALRLKSSAGLGGQSSYPVLLLSLVLAIILTLWWPVTSRKSSRCSVSSVLVIASS